MRSTVRTAVTLALAAAVACTAAPARAEWMQPDASWREALLMVRLAARDTAGHADDPARLDSLGVALLRVGRFDEAGRLLGAALALAPHDEAARAGLGKLALFRDDLAAAENLLAGPAAGDPGARADLLATRVRAGRWVEAAAVADDAGLPGRGDLLRRMAERGAYTLATGPAEGEAFFARSSPVPLVKVRLNGQSVLMAIDTGAGDLLIDESAARRCRVATLPGRFPVPWSGSLVTVQGAWVSRLEIAGFRIDELPAGTLGLRRWSVLVNPQGERVAGVIGLGLLRRFVPTLDYPRGRLVLRRPGVPVTYGADAVREPFEMWGEHELTVWGSFASGRRMAMVVQTGVPGCGVGAPREVFDEVGIKAGAITRTLQGAGSWLQGHSWVPVTVPAVTVGRVSEDKVQGLIGALDSAELWRHGVRRDALLSHDFFRHRRVTFDWDARALVFEGRD